MGMCDGIEHNEMFSLPTVSLASGFRVRACTYSFFAVLIIVIAVYYLFLLSNGTLQIIAPEAMDKVFNSMLEHLLRGEFTVDREAIGFEAFTRDGETYAYFGVFPALLRLLAMPFTDIAQASLARLSCVTAVVVFVILQLRMLLIVHDSLPAGSRMPAYLAVMVAATILSGPQLYILGSAAIYHEAILWSAALAAAFNLVVLRAAFGGGLRTRDLATLAALAGLALITRPSIGAALYLGTVLLVGWLAWRRHGADRRERPLNLSAALGDASVALPFAILGLMAAVAGTINFARWGNPFVFADFNDYFWFQQHPEFIAVLHNYGEFNLGRIWIGALYYATGIPYFLKTVQPFAGFLASRVAGVEAPPFTPLLTNPLTVLLAAIGIYRLWWKPDLTGERLAILRLALVGNALAVFLVFAAMMLVMRYRFDFAPFMTLASLVGYRSVAIAAAGAGPQRCRQLRIIVAGLCIVGILGSHYVLLVHKVWSFAVPIEVRLALFPFAPFARPAFQPGSGIAGPPAR